MPVCAYVRPCVGTLRAALRAFKLRVRVKNSFPATLVQQNCFYISHVCAKCSTQRTQRVVKFLETVSCTFDIDIL